MPVEGGALPVIDALIVTYNSRRYIGRCVRSLRRHVPNCRIHIVDNASTDGTRKLLPRLKPDSLTLNDENRYLSPVWNEFLRESASEFVLLVNPDVEVKSGVCVEKALAAMRQDPLVVAAGSVVEISFLDLLKWQPPARPADRDVFRDIIEGSLAAGVSRDSVKSGHFNGALVLLRRAAVLDLGGFNERLPLYYNDTELSWRVLRGGRKLADVWQPDDGTVLHHAGASSRAAAPGLRLRLFRLRRLAVAGARAKCGCGGRDDGGTQQ